MTFFLALGLGDSETVFRDCINTSDHTESCVDADLGPVSLFSFKENHDDSHFAPSDWRNKLLLRYR